MKFIKILKIILIIKCEMNRNAPKMSKNLIKLRKKREFQTAHQFHIHIYTT